MTVAVAVPPPPVVPPDPPGLPLRARDGGLRRFSVAEYDALGRAGVLTPRDRVELLEGCVVQKMSQNPPHAGTVYLLQEVLRALLPAGWIVRGQSAVTLSDSKPEPDGAVVRGDRTTYLTRHPGPADFGIVIEVADSSVAEDRSDMARIYARAGLPAYWIVNIPDRQVEVYTDPRPAADPPAYTRRQDYKPGEAVPVVLDGAAVAEVSVADLLL